MEGRRIENVAHMATKSPIPPSLLAKANRSPTLFHLEYYSGFWTLLRGLSWHLPAFAMGPRCRAACGLLKHCKCKLWVFPPIAILLVLCGTRRHSGESLMFRVEHMVHGHMTTGAIYVAK